MSNLCPDLLEITLWFDAIVLRLLLSTLAPAHLWLVAFRDLTLFGRSKGENSRRLTSLFRVWSISVGDGVDDSRVVALIAHSDDTLTSL